jgi:protein phosphatase PTC1
LSVSSATSAATTSSAQSEDQSKSTSGSTITAGKADDEVGGGRSLSLPVNSQDSTSPAGTPSKINHQRKPSIISATTAVIPEENSPTTEGQGQKKSRRTGSTVGNKARDIFSSAKNGVWQFGSSSSVNVTEQISQSQMQKLSKEDPALGVPQGSHNNSAGESIPGPNSTFRVGVTEDRNKKCRRTMEDTHAYLYNFLSTPARSTSATASNVDPADTTAVVKDGSSTETPMVETDNGYFAIFDGHAGTFAADWCGKKLHIVLEDTIRKHPNTPIPELLDQTFTLVDQQLEKLPVKNSGCTAVIAVLRWEDRVPSSQSATGSAFVNVAAAQHQSGKSSTAQSAQDPPVAPTLISNVSDVSVPGSTTAVAGSPPPIPASGDTASSTTTTVPPPINKSNTTESLKTLKSNATRQRVLYTANVGDARIILCRAGKALRLSYDHKGSDENEGRRVHNAGGLILNNRVNGVLAVTRALGDAYMKDLVTGHPYTTETVIQEEVDEFMILACDGVS